jgi:hypothetical protein
MLPSKLPSRLRAGRVNGASRMRFQEESYTIFLILSSPNVIIVEFAHGASFEQDLRKMKKTRG